MIISIASGKGGTGKTTVAVNLAAAVSGEVQLLDCDVEEPNAHLFLKPAIQESVKAWLPTPDVDTEKCSHCGKCADICRFRAIVDLNETVLTFPELCHSCGGCVEICPEKAIRESGRELGEIDLGERGVLDFAHGRLKIGEAMAPPLIRQVRSREKASHLVIIDAPPGTSCPVIAAMKKTDFVMLVTEPTPFGLHDLTLAVEAVKILGIPHGLIINRSDLGDDRVKAFAEKEQIQVLMEIPFDRQIAETYSRGELMIDTLPVWRDRFIGLYEKIKEVVGNGSC